MHFFPSLILAVAPVRVLDESMRSVLLRMLMGVMLFCSLESAVDASMITAHHGEAAAHETHRSPGPAPDHDDDDCFHFCHCTAHLPSIVVVNGAIDELRAAPQPFPGAVKRYISYFAAPPLRPPIL